MRTPPIPITILAVILAGCGSLRGEALRTCDGKHLRPANLHGSVLDASAGTMAVGAAAQLPAHPSCGR